MKRIVVFCGSSGGHDPVFAAQAFRVGQYLAENGIELVYGGARVGLMGAVADGTLQGVGRVIGVLPHFLRTKEVAHEHLTELVLVAADRQQRGRTPGADATVPAPYGPKWITKEQT
jgi:uncharacterized protein (TIGR00730 family)